ncbi:hypothetical protein HYPSUDRAFT_946119 [Hypholoma sublateritium FD-334 SS-4]|uniref:Uncharacterized protein n=1 Tax=Hypholoma sublateritium (strain FD-334 SS-4) TaxID=945553 RepID=A0A0D2Q703_HYPSF|nr:hypothetical protein HYPSUDRAFT_946119 [Hypholoma sublateritium FD-334 SS-4]
MASMHYVPMPTPRQNPESLLALRLLSDKKESHWTNEKRSSMKSVASASSVYSQQSHITPYPYTPPPGSGNDQYRPQSPAYSPPAGRMNTQRSPANDQYRPRSPAYSPSAGPPQGPYRVQDPGYAQASRQPNGQYLSQPPVYNAQTAGPQYTAGQDMTRLAPPFDGNRPGTPGSMRLAEPTTLGPQINRPAPTYDYNRSRTPVARASDFNRSRTPGGSMESDRSAPGRDPQETRIPPFEYYRSVTPAMSMRSVALTNASSIRTAPRQRYYRNDGIPAPTPLSATGRKPSLTLAFSERVASPMSPALSNTSFYMPLKPQVSAPPGLAPVGPGFKFPPPPLNTQNGSPISPLSQPSPVVPPVALQLRQVLQDADSPSVYSPHSADTLFMPRNAALSSSVPRSPSPQAVSFPNLPPTALSAALPARPELSPALYIGRYGSPAPDGQRQWYGSPDVSVGDSPTLGNEQYRSDFRREQPDRTLTGSPADDRITSVSQWRQKIGARRS